MTTTFAHTPSTWRRQMLNALTTDALAEADTAIRALRQLRCDGLSLPCEMGDVVRLAGVKLAEVERMYGGSDDDH